MMYAGAGYVIELLSGKTWEDFVRERILLPLGMTSTVFSIDEMVKQPEHGVPFTERRDSFEVVLKEDGNLGVVFPGQPFQALIPWKPQRFRVKEFSDVVFEFVVSNGQVKELKRIDPSGEYTFRRK